MPLLPDREFALPRRRAGRRWVWVAVAAVHLSVIWLLIANRRAPIRIALTRSTIALADTTRDMLLPAVRRAVAHPTPDAHAASPVVTPAVAPPPPPPPVGAPPVTVAATVPIPRVDSPPVGASLHPHYGTGQLWVEPLVESPRKIASVLTGKTPSQLTDSVVATMIQTYLDEMAKENRDHPSALPSWTTKIGGKTVGIDPKWIYLGPLKIPTALLALLPIRVQANPTQAEFNAKLQAMRADLFEAARRSANYDEFKQAVKDLHEQKEREREFQKNQRTAPDTSKHG